MIDDVRGRVPFALVGVLLLTGSVTLTATVGTYDPGGPPPVDRAMDGATAATMTELRGAADDAATVTAAAPVTRPAETSAGRALDDSAPFEDALRLRLYLLAADRLDGVEVGRQGTTATASLPEVDATVDGYRAAIERVHVERAGEDGAALRVEIEGVTLTASRGDRTVATEEMSPTFVVANPALALHERTARFERRANAPVTEDGLARRLTARLYPTAWVRGYAQYGGAPISTVVDNRHVELATNDGLLAEQRAVFGTADPGGQRGVAAAGRRVVIADALRGVGGDDEWTDFVLAAADRVGEGPPADRPVGTWDEAADDPAVTVAVERSADRAYADLVGIDGTDDLAAIVDRAYTVEARVDVDVDARGVERHPTSAPGADWQRTDRTTRRDVEATEVAGRAPVASGWSTRDGAVFRVTETETTTTTWRRGSERRTTAATIERRYRVGVAVQVRTVPIDGVPAGDLDGTLDAATRRAVDRAVRDVRGLQGAARAAVVDPDEAGTTARASADPSVDRDRLEADLRGLREEVRELSTTVPATAAGSGRANPPRRLGRALADRRPDLRGEAGTSAPTRTRLATRSAYLEAVDGDLERRARAHAETNHGLEDAVADHLDAGRLDGALAAHRAANRPDPERFVDPAGDLTFAVDAGPSYLPTGEVRRERIDPRGRGDGTESTVRPLAARNVNVFSSPHDQVAAAVVGRIPGVSAEGVSLETAARTLAVLEDADAATEVEFDRFSAEREALAAEVESSAAHVRDELIAALVEAGVDERDAREAFAVDGTTAEVALSLANGTVEERAVEALADDGTRRDRLRVRLATAREAALRDEAARPSRTATADAAEAGREALRDELETVVADGVESAAERARTRALGEQLGSIPAGLPLVPVPGHWYATANVWYVEVGGTYERFAVRADRGGPNAATTYLRDGRTATLHHDGDRVRLGTAERLSFRTETAVIVVVPPGGNGVGDTDGELDDRTPGWPP